MANGLMGFPQFAPGGEGGLIPSIQMPASNVSAMFPRTSGGGGGKTEVNPAAPLTAGIVGAIANEMLPQPKAKPTKVTPDASTNEVLALADTLYGPDREDPTLFQNIAPYMIDALAASAFGDEGGLQYAQTAINRRTALKKGERDIAAAKAQYIKENTKRTYTPILMQNTESAALGISDKLAGFAVKDGRNAYYIIPDGKGGYKKAPKEWVQWRSDAPSLVDAMKDPDFVKLDKLDSDQLEKDENTMNVLRTLNSAVNSLEGADPLTVVSTVMNFGNDAWENFKQGSEVIKEITGRDSAFSISSADETGGSYGRVGTGEFSKLLQDALDTKDPETIRLALDQWEEVYGDDPELSLKALFGQSSFDRTDTASAILKAGYMLAAANGQTGRTLSDKDLAFHLKMLGYGATQDSDVAQDMLLKVGDGLIEGIDTGTQMKFNPYKLSRLPKANNPRYGVIFGNYFDTVQDDEGIDVWTNPATWKPKSFGQRYAYVKDINDTNFYQEWIKHQGTYYTDRYDKGAGTDLAPKTQISPAEQFELTYESILGELED